MDYRRWRHRKTVRRASNVSRALTHARAATRLTLAEVGRALGVAPKTVRRWELGEARPQERHWPAIFGLYTRFGPALVAELAANAGRPVPASAVPSALDPKAATQVLANAADALDVAPKRVLDVLRATLHAAGEANVPIELLMRAVAE